MKPFDLEKALAAHTKPDLTGKEAVQWCIDNRCDFVTPIFPPPPGWAWCETDTALVLSPIFTLTDQGGDITAEEVARKQGAPVVSGLVAHLVALLEHARCNTCDGSGALYDGHGQVRQCQWCHDRRAALNACRNGGEV